jgi:hypothetical protein
MPAGSKSCALGSEEQNRPDLCVNTGKAIAFTKEQSRYNLTIKPMPHCMELNVIAVEGMIQLTQSCDPDTQSLGASVIEISPDQIDLLILWLKDAKMEIEKACK